MNKSNIESVTKQLLEDVLVGLLRNTKSSLAVCGRMVECVGLHLHKILAENWGIEKQYCLQGNIILLINI